MEDEELDVMLLVGEAVQRHEQELKEARREVVAMLIEDAWRTAMRSRHYLTSQCLDTPSESAWMVLFEYGSDLNFLNATSLTRIAFRQLLHPFAACYTIRDPNSRGRPPKLQYLHQVLGLVLVFYTGSMEQSTLSMLFGVPASTLSRTLQRAERVLNQALNDYKPSRIAWPSPAHQAKLAKLVEAREPMLKHTFGFIDDKNLRVQQPSNADMQNAMYNVWSKHNCPGSWNDSDTSLEFRSKLLDPGRAYSDAFERWRSGSNRTIPSKLSQNPLHNAITSVRQAAEWGMGSIQKVYCRLNLPLPYDPELRGMRLDNLFRLVNYRV
ncbi:hypothetical protein PPTG_10171 [Phytophthora nicotianae INRA-310]|uniref:DDE Tnp4 domain-containing protein n=1 Tax=Phytophthora nicotianae (strain INRA-310) TaxID=761204 RepID=W2QFD7_PHYN3|nr:hypothetical protein PPTG_10171 [Phytophthora nicotianae INRA-310]ETN11224.1 hypothetical protein PPTG_10171 [Phytophthora nicotianae INRA-310]